MPVTEVMTRSGKAGNCLKVKDYLKRSAIRHHNIFRVIWAVVQIRLLLWVLRYAFASFYISLWNSGIEFGCPSLSPLVNP